jgi:chemotaxis response regulator CheB
MWHAYNATWRIVHKRKKINEIKHKSDFSEVYQMVQELQPDVIILHEVFDDLQTVPIKSYLQKL